MDIRLDDIAQLVEDFRQAARLFLQMYLAAFDAAHIQHVVNKAQKVVAGGHDFLQVFLHLLLVVNVGDGQGGKADDGVHGSADVVGHVGKEDALGPAGPVGLGEGILQQRLFLPLFLRLLVDGPEAQHHPVAFVPVPGPDRLHLEVADIAAADGTVVQVAHRLFQQLLEEMLAGGGLAHSLLVLRVDPLHNILIDAVLQNQLAGENGLQDVVRASAGPQGPPLPSVQVEVANQVIVHAEGVNQLHLPPAVLGFLLLLEGAVQQELLVEYFLILLDELKAAHDVQQGAVLVEDAVIQIGGIPHLFQGVELLLQLGAVLLHHPAGDRMEAVRRQLLLGGVVQDAQGRLVDADDAGAVQGMAEDTAVDGGEDGLQHLVFAGDLLGIGPFQGDVQGHPHRAHHGAVQVIKRGFVGGKDLLFPSGLDDLLGDVGLPALHHRPLRFDAGGVILLHIPDVGVSLTLHLFLGFAYRFAETVVYLFVDAVLRLVPNEVGGAVDGRLQVLAGLPQVFGVLPFPLPFFQAKAPPGGGDGKGPNIGHLRRKPLKKLLRPFYLHQKD